MRRNMLLPFLAVAGGLAGAALRLREWNVCFSPETLTFNGGTMLLLVFMAVLLATFAVCLRGGQTPPDVLSAWRCPEPLYFTCKVLAAFLMLAAGVLALVTGLTDMRVWRYGGSLQVTSSPAPRIICGIFCILAFPCMLKTAQSFYRGTLNGMSGILSVAPPAAGLIWILTIHLEHGTDPVLASYGYQLAAAIFLMLAHYYVAAGFYAGVRARRAAFFCLAGTATGLVSMADRPGIFQTVMTLSMLISALADTPALIRALFGPPWPRRLLERSRRRPEEEEEDGDLPDGTGGEDPSATREYRDL